MVDIKNKMTIAQNTYFLGAAATNVMAAPSRRAIQTEDGAARKSYGLCGKWGVSLCDGEDLGERGSKLMGDG